MTIVLLRVDERLIHGQVVVGWGNQLRPTKYVVIDDELAASSWEQDLYKLAVPSKTDVAFLTRAEACEAIAEMKDDPEARIVMLLRTLDTARTLAQDGVLEGMVLNLGGLHHRDGCNALRGYLHLNEDDRQALADIKHHGLELVGQDLPSSPKVPIEELLGNG